MMWRRWSLLALGLVVTVLAPPRVHAQETSRVSYRDSPYAGAFSALYNQLGEVYPCFELKQIDWDAVWTELEPDLEHTQDDAAFGVLCTRLIARLQDNHAVLLPGTAPYPAIPLPSYDPGFACLHDQEGQLVVYVVEPNSPADDAGIVPGFVLTHIDDVHIDDVFAQQMATIRDFIGYSSERCARYDVARRVASVHEQGRGRTFRFLDLQDDAFEVELPASVGARYLPRLPVPIEGVRDAANVSWTRLSDAIGYIYVRRIRAGLEDQLDEALRNLPGIHALIIDLRGNSGGGFDGRSAFLNFDPRANPIETGRPHFTGPIAMLTDARCISAGEGWLSWFVATERAVLFGETTAGASARKQEFEIAGGLYRCRIPVRPYRGSLDRPIEHQGIEPHIPVGYDRLDLARGRDTVLQAAIEHFLADDN